jgi:hypothetical protein
MKNLLKAVCLVASCSVVGFASGATTDERVCKSSSFESGSVANIFGPLGVGTSVRVEGEVSVWPRGRIEVMGNGSLIFGPGAILTGGFGPAEDHASADGSEAGSASPTQEHAPLTINSGTLIIQEEFTNRGEFVLLPGSTISIEEGGSLSCGPGSTIRGALSSLAGNPD